VVKQSIMVGEKQRSIQKVLSALAAKAKESGATKRERARARGGGREGGRREGGRRGKGARGGGGDGQPERVRVGGLCSTARHD
jgi:hypothetical protein